MGKGSTGSGLPNYSVVQLAMTGTTTKDTEGSLTESGPPPRDHVQQELKSAATSLAATDFSDSWHIEKQSQCHADSPSGQAEAVLHIEYVTGRQMKRLVLLSNASVCCGLIVLGWLFGWKYSKGANYFIVTDTLPRFNTVVAGMCLLALSACLQYAVRRLLAARHKLWSRRRRRLTTLFMAELVAQTINAAAYLAPNVYVLVHECAWFDIAVNLTGLLRWSCWNVIWLLAVVHGSNAAPWTSRRPQDSYDGAIILDAPWSYHWLKLVIAISFETFLILVIIHITSPLFGNACYGSARSALANQQCGAYYSPQHPGNCRLAHYGCYTAAAEIGAGSWQLWVLTTLMTVAVIAMFAAYVLYILRALRALRAQPYRPYRMANVSVRLQLRMRLVAITFFALSMFLLWFLKFGTCTAYLESWLGLAPCQIVATTSAIINVLLYLPEDPSGPEPVLQTRLQEFSWTEADQPAALAARGLPSEPMFCFETAVKCFYWSNLVYRYDGSALQPPAGGSKACQDVTVAIGLPAGSSQADTSSPPASPSAPASLRLRAACAAAPEPPPAPPGPGGVPQPAAGMLVEQSYSAGTSQRQGSKSDGQHDLGQRVLEAPAAAIGPAAAEAVAGGEEAQPDVGARGERSFSLAAALAMYGLTHSELLWERRLDTKALVGWSRDTVVVTFRGTCSWANVCADIRAWREPHPPRRGRWWLGSQPLVHAGFLASWTANGFHQRLLDRLRAIIAENAGAPGHRLKVVVTGHSLGGALALLAAYDIQRTCSALCALDVVCYTFGAPRTGNHAFADEYARAVPDTWHIINDQDAVARGGKLVCLYKRPGQRVLINGGGDLIVRPSWLEASIQRTPAGYSVNHHYLRSYQKSLVAIINAQLTPKRLAGGLSGVRALAASTNLRQVFSAAVAVKLEVLRGLSRGPSLRQHAAQGAVQAALNSSLPRPGWLHGNSRRNAAAAGAEEDLALPVVTEDIAGPIGKEVEEEADDAQEAVL